MTACDGMSGNVWKVFVNTVHALTVVSENVVLSLITNCIHVVLLVYQKGLIY